MTPAPLQTGHAPSELALNSAGLTPFALANALRIGSSRPMYVAGLLRREPRIASWSMSSTPSRSATEPLISELLPDHEHRVALVAQAQQQLVHPPDVVGMQPDGRLVEDVGDVGQRGAEVA